MSLRSPTYSTLHQNLSAVSGFSELPAQSPRQERSYSNLASRMNHCYSWNHDPEANAPEVVQAPQTMAPTHVAYSPPVPPKLMPDHSIPEVVPVEHRCHKESLPEVVAHAPFHPTTPFNTGLGVVLQPQLQVPLQPQRSLSQAQERRQKTRARLNLIAGD